MRTDEPTGRSRTRRRGARVWLLAASVVTLVLAAAALGAGWFLLQGEGGGAGAGRPVRIEILPGSTTAEIADQLADAGVVRDSLRFRLSVRMAQADGALRAGTYELATGMPDAEVVDRLKAGPPVRYTTVTIPEGFTVKQIAARLEEVAGIPSAEFEKLALTGAERFASRHPYLKGAYGGSLEGFLFPKTYRIEEGATAVDVIEMMLSQFDKETRSLDLTSAKRDGFDLYEIVTIASAIERETRVQKEQALVSSVIHNRLKRGMRLQLCATVEYVLPGNRLRLSDEDLAIDSPYNTYRHAGLPPGPIANPGLAALKAAAAPADTDFIYYVLTGKDGTHTFATNWEDFLRAKRTSKEVFGE